MTVFHLIVIRGSTGAVINIQQQTRRRMIATSTNAGILHEVYILEYGTGEEETPVCFVTVSADATYADVRQAAGPSMSNRTFLRILKSHNRMSMMKESMLCSLRIMNAEIPSMYHVCRRCCKEYERKAWFDKHSKVRRQISSLIGALFE